jgi:transcription initiation factor TFIIE subunit alpha
MAKEILNLCGVQSYLKNVDQSAGQLLNVWDKNPNVTCDEFFTQHLDCKITVIRSILNKLHFYGIVNYDKIKNENSGWFTFKWHLDYEKLAKLVLINNLDKLEKLNINMKKYEQYQMFTCSNSCKDFEFEVAAHYNFYCPMCNENLNLLNQKERRDEIKTQIDTIEEENSILSGFLKDKNKKA